MLPHGHPVEISVGVVIILLALWLGSYGAQQTLGGDHPTWDRVTVIGLTPRGMVANLGLCAVLAVAVVAF